MKQAQQIALADQYQSRAQVNMDMYLVMLENGIDLSFRDSQGIPTPTKDLTGIPLAQRSAYVGWALTGLDNIFYQRELGFLDDDAWSAVLNRIDELFSREDRIEEIFLQTMSTYRKPFADFIESQVLNNHIE